METEMNDRYLPRFGNPITPWFRVFAWRPVQTVDRGTVWLRRVYKRRIQTKEYLQGASEWWWQYAVAPSNKKGTK